MTTNINLFLQQHRQTQRSNTTLEIVWQQLLQSVDLSKVRQLGMQSTCDSLTRFICFQLNAKSCLQYPGIVSLLCARVSKRISSSELPRVNAFRRLVEKGITHHVDVCCWPCDVAFADANAKEGIVSRDKHRTQQQQPPQHIAHDLGS